MTMTRLDKDKAKITAIFHAHCSGIEIPILAMPGIMRAGLDALYAAKGEQSVIDAVVLATHRARFIGRKGQ
jgi:hypothetical protein